MIGVSALAVRNFSDQNLTAKVVSGLKPRYRRALGLSRLARRSRGARVRLALFAGETANAMASRSREPSRWMWDSRTSTTG